MTFQFFYACAFQLHITIQKSKPMKEARRGNCLLQSSKIILYYIITIQSVSKKKFSKSLNGKFPSRKCSVKALEIQLRRKDLQFLQGNVPLRHLLNEEHGNITDNISMKYSIIEYFCVRKIFGKYCHLHNQNYVYNKKSRKNVRIIHIYMLKMANIWRLCTLLNVVKIQIHY